MIGEISKNMVDKKSYLMDLDKRSILTNAFLIFLHKKTYVVGTH